MTTFSPPAKLHTNSRGFGAEPSAVAGLLRPRAVDPPLIFGVDGCLRRGEHVFAQYFRPAGSETPWGYVGTADDSYAVVRRRRSGWHFLLVDTTSGAEAGELAPNLVRFGGRMSFRRRTVQFRQALWSSRRGRFGIAPDVSVDACLVDPYIRGGLMRRPRGREVSALDPTFCADTPNTPVPGAPYIVRLDGATGFVDDEPALAVLLAFGCALWRLYLTTPGNVGGGGP